MVKSAPPSEDRIWLKSRQEDLNEIWERLHEMGERRRKWEDLRYNILCSLGFAAFLAFCALLLYA